MLVSVIAPLLIVAGVVSLVLGSLPVENSIEGNNLVVKFVIGKKTIDISDAVVMPIPEEVNHNIIRVGGTSVGKKALRQLHERQNKNEVQILSHRKR